jgi:hypothetical protein
MTSEPTDLELAFAVLKDTGASGEEAAAVLQYDPSVTGRLQLQIARKRAEVLQARADQAREQFEASPAGRADAARYALKAQAERRELIAGARALLEQDGGSAEGLSDERVLHLTGIEPSVEAMTLRERDEAQLELASHWRTLSPLEQAEQSQALGIESASVEKYVREFIEDGSGDEAGEG